VSILIVWRSTGYLSAFFRAGFQAIPRELYEAAVIDGAGWLRTFTNVTLPMLRPVAVFVALRVCIGPMTWAVSSSFKPTGDIFEYPPRLIPSPPSGRKYADPLSGQPLFAWLATSFRVAIVSTVLAVLVCSLANYGFACFRFVGKRFLFDLMFSSLAIPFVVIAAPLFIMLSMAGSPMSMSC
jgi:ABC-type glycerol-3-phosphate transport system permease component